MSGAEAVEIALKSALATTGRRAVLAFEPAYHGLTLGALAATSRPAFRAPFAAHLHPHLRRLPFGAGLAEVERELAAGDVACALVEPIVGREGVLVPPAGWLAGLAAACRRHGALFAADEVFTGFGRTGRLFAVEHEGVAPDLLCCGKALGGGFPLAAVVGRRSVFRCWQVAGEALHTATFVANPLACAAALAVLEVLEEDDLAARAAALGAIVGARLAGWPARFAAVAAVRGRGLLWGIELADRAAAGRLVQGALRRGVLLLAGGPEGRVAQIVPPLTVVRSAAGRRPRPARGDAARSGAARCRERPVNECGEGPGGGGLTGGDPMSSAAAGGAFKVAFVGSHGVGKTTLCYGLAARLKRRDLAVEVVHEVARRCPLPINQQTSVAAQSWILHTQVSEELVAASRYPVVLCDRSLLDNYVYLLLAAGRQPQLEPLLAAWMPGYALLVHVPLVELPSPDGIRAADPAFQRAVEDRLCRELDRAPPASALPGGGGPRRLARRGRARGLVPAPPGPAAAADRRMNRCRSATMCGP